MKNLKGVLFEMPTLAGKFEFSSVQHLHRFVLTRFADRKVLRRFKLSTRPTRPNTLDWLPPSYFDSSISLATGFILVTSCA